MRPRLIGVVAVLAASHARTASAQCTFSNEIDPYTQYNDLNGDNAAQSSDQCKSNCCGDTACTVWQWSDDPMTPPNCWRGSSTDYGDSGGVEWQGEQGKAAPGPAPAPGPGPTPAPGPAPAPAPGGGKVAPGAKCIGVHCTQDEMQSNWGTLFCWGLAGLCGLYMAGGIYSNSSAGKSGAELIPNVYTWSALGGLVKDGIMVTMGNTVEKQAQYEPVPRMDPSLLEAAAGGVICGGEDVEAGGRGLRGSRRSRGSSGGVVVVGPDGQKKRKKKKKGAGGDEAGDKIVVIDPVTGKKKVKRKVKKGDPKVEAKKKKKKKDSSAAASPVVKVKNSKGGGGGASLE